MSFFCDDVDTALGGYHTSAYTGLGLRGDQVPATGADGPSALYPCLSLPADAATEVFMQLTRLPTLGTLTPDEDGSFVYTGATDYFEFRLWAAGVPFTADIGFGPGIVRVSLAVGVQAIVGSPPGRAVVMPVAVPAIVARMGWRAKPVLPVIKAASNLAPLVADAEPAAQPDPRRAQIEAMLSAMLDQVLAAVPADKRATLPPDRVRVLVLARFATVYPPARLIRSKPKAAA